MKQQPCIAFDMDEVLCAIRGLCAEALSRHTGINVPWTEWRFYEMYRIYGMSMDRMLDIIIEEKILERGDAEPYAAETVRTAIGLGFRTAVVSSREYHPRARQLTEDWLSRKSIPIGEVHIAGIHVKKSEVLKNIGNVVAYIDDHQAHLDQIALAGAAKETYVLTQRWNRGAWGHRRVDNLAEFKTQIIRLGNIHLHAAESRAREPVALKC